MCCCARAVLFLCRPPALLLAGMEMFSGGQGLKSGGKMQDAKDRMRKAEGSGDRPRRPSPRRATREVLARALVILAALQEDDFTRDDLIACVTAELGEAAYGDAPEDAFLRDIKWLQALGFEVAWMPDAGRYHLEAGDNPLVRLKLAPDELYVLSLLRRAFERTPYAGDVASLVNRVAGHLTQSQQAQIKQAAPVSVLIPMLDDIEPHRFTLQKVQEAISQRRRLEFEYRSRTSEKNKRHVVTVYDSLELREGHLYFQGRSDRTDNDLEFRLDRVAPGTARLLPAKVATTDKPRHPLRLRYWLSREFAGQGATRRFRNHQEERQEDGSLIVTAEIDESELFWASKTLLKYGENCVVLEPPELVAEMRRVVGQTARNYEVARSQMD